MRHAVARVYRDLTGQDPEFTLSGWSDLTEAERAAVEDRAPDPQQTLFELDDAIEQRRVALLYLADPGPAR